MRSMRSYLPVLILVALAVLVFGVFVGVYLTQPPEVQQATGQAVSEAEGEAPAAEAEVTEAPAAERPAEPTAETTTGAAVPQDETATVDTVEPTEEAAAAPAAADATAEATEPADNGEAPGEPEEEPTPTSRSRVQDSILIMTQVTPVLESRGVSLMGAVSADGGDGEDMATPTSRSRVTQSIILGGGQGETGATEPAPEQEDATGEGGDGEAEAQADAPDDAANDGGQADTEAMPTPTSRSRVTQSIILGEQDQTEAAPAAGGGNGDGSDGGAAGGGGGEAMPTPTSRSRVTQSIILGAEREATEAAPAEVAEEATAETTEVVAAEPGTEVTEAAAAATAETTEVAALPMPTPVPGEPNDAPSLLQTRGPVAEQQADLWWFMLVVGTAVWLFVLALVGVILWQRNRGDHAPVSEGLGRLFVYGGGIAMPLVILTVLFALTLSTMAALALGNQQTELTIEVTGQRWWWEIRYPDQDFVTANEIHIPVGQPVRFELTSADVIHSFWVPELGGKLDLFPNRTTVFWLQADEPGEYRGLCAEFCGIQHANMALLVVADDVETFNTWVQGQQLPADEPGNELEARGREVFLEAGCIACHQIRGTNAAGQLGPDLTHLASRRTLGAATIPNTPGHLAGWIVDSQGIKPGNLMPPQDVAGQDLQALLAYLNSLK